MEYLKDKLFNKAELARRVNMSPELFRMKLNNVNYNKFNTDEKVKLMVITTEIQSKLQDCWVDLCSDSLVETFNEMV